MKHLTCSQNARKVNALVLGCPSTKQKLLNYLLHTGQFLFQNFTSCQGGGRKIYVTTLLHYNNIVFKFCTWPCVTQDTNELFGIVWALANRVVLFLLWLFYNIVHHASSWVTKFGRCLLLKRFSRNKRSKRGQLSGRTSPPFVCLLAHSVPKSCEVGSLLMDHLDYIKGFVLRGRFRSDNCKTVRGVKL